MGAWGEKGFDNDTAADWLDGLEYILNFTLLRAFWSRWKEEGIAAATLLTELPNRIQERLGIHVFSEALEVVEEELKPEHIKPWKHPKKRLKFLSQLRSALLSRHSLFKVPKRRRRTINHEKITRVSRPK